MIIYLPGGGAKRFIPLLEGDVVLDGLTLRHVSSQEEGMLGIEQVYRRLSCATWIYILYDIPIHRL